MECDSNHTSPTPIPHPPEWGAGVGVWCAMDLILRVVHVVLLTINATLKILELANKAHSLWAKARRWWLLRNKPR